LAGRLVYVMGPSGAGKDTLLKHARARLAGSAILFAHRYITRAPVAGDENFISLTSQEFEARLDLFTFHWKAHGHCYGIGIEVERWRDMGRTVVVSGSREHFTEALLGRADIIPVLIIAPPEVLSARLAARGREDRDAIASRLERGAIAEADHPCLKRIENIGAPAEAGDRLAAVIRACAVESA
jgi:ribose 1,5-bisphosphokinase